MYRSTWWHLAVFQTVQTHAQLFFYAHQYFQVHPKFQSTSIIQQTMHVNLGEDRGGPLLYVNMGEIGVACNMGVDRGDL